MLKSIVLPKRDNMAPITYVEAPHSLWGKETRVLLERAFILLRLSEFII